MCYSARIKQDIDALGLTYQAVVDRSRFDDYRQRSNSQPKRFPPLRERIYPGHCAPVVINERGQRVISLRRYGIDHGSSPSAEKRGLCPYNARRDNLGSPFWAECFLRHHGFVAMNSFFEWVMVRDLLQAGVVTVDQVRETFARQSMERKIRIAASGKRYAPTATESQDIESRRIIVEFFPTFGEDLLVPVIGSAPPGNTDSQEGSFAVITDDPPLEVRRAGHERCPVVLNRDEALGWIDSEHSSARQADEWLSRRREVIFGHRLAEDSHSIHS